MNCQHCGHKISSGDIYCPNCGERVSDVFQSEEYEDEVAVTRPEKSKLVAALLAAFLGVFGAHNFYLGYNNKAIIQLIFTVTTILAPVSAIWALVDFIMICVGEVKDSDGREMSWNTK